MEFKSKMHLGPSFDSQRYDEREREAQENYGANNKRAKGLRLRRKRFSIRALAKKIASVRKSFMLRIKKQQTLRQHPNATDASQESVNAPVTSEAIVSQAADDTDGKLQLEHLLVQKGHVHRMAQLLEPRFKGNKVSEKHDDSEQCSRFDGSPMTTQVDPPSPAGVQDLNFSKPKLVHQSLGKSIGASTPSAPSDEVTEEVSPNSEVTFPPSSEAAAGEGSTPPNVVYDEGELSTPRTQCTEKKSRHRYCHQLPEMEQLPRIEQGLVKRLTLQIELRLQGSFSPCNAAGPSLQMKSSSLTSSFDGKNEDDEITIRIKRRRERIMKLLQSMNDYQASA